MRRFVRTSIPPMRSGPAILLVLWLGGCGTDNGGLIPDPNSVTTCQLDPVFSSLYPKLFKVNCAASACHGRSGVSRNGLRMDQSEEQALMNLLSDTHAADFQATYPKRVVPMKPDESFLWHVLTDDSLPEELHMPVGDRLSQCELDPIKKWIEDGAPP